MYASDYTLLSILKRDVKHTFTATSSPSLSFCDGDNPLLNGIGIRLTGTLNGGSSRSSLFVAEESIAMGKYKVVVALCKYEKQTQPQIRI